MICKTLISYKFTEIRCVRIMNIEKCAERNPCNLYICRVIKEKSIQWMYYDIPTPHDKKA